jgi:flagellar biosynthesis GTPase FlhF
MPRHDDKKHGKKNRSKNDDDSSVDSKGNIRNLIDYDYSESSSEEMFKMEVNERPPRKAKIVAKKKIRKELGLPSDSSESPKMRRKRIAKEEADIVKPKKYRTKPMLIVESDEEEEEVKKPKRPAKILKKSKRKEVEEEESFDEDEDETEEEDEEDEEDEEEDDEDDEDEEEEEEPRLRRGGGIDIVISDLLGGGGRDPNKPRKYNLKKESASVRRFVELVQKEDEEEDTIDNDITYFKSLTGDKQNNLLKVLEHKASPGEVQIPLKFKILEKVAKKPDLNRIAMAKYNALCNIEPSSTEYYKVSHWIDGFTGIPLAEFKDLPVKMEDGAEKCHEFMSTVHKCMESAIYGHEEPKLQIMQFVSSWIANPKANGNVLSIHGPPGVGKTSLIKDGVAKALGRPFHFISLGGATDASFLDGHSYTYEGSTWGKIVDVLIQSKCMNPVIYFDELDKVSETPKGDEIMNILIHLTDGSQNDRFQDKYFTGVDLDLSRCLFIFSHNNHEKVNPILRDRMYNIEVKGFSLKDKLLIAENYLLVAALKESGLHEKISISKDILQHVIENFTGGEAGVRELKRCIQTIVSKINLLRFYNDPKQVPFAIKDFALPFTLKKEHVELFLKKKAEMDSSIAHLYM